MSKSTDNSKDIFPGEIYEDSAYHPCLCVGVESDYVWGISLIDGSQPRTTDRFLEGIRKLTINEAWEIKYSWKGS